MLKLKSCFNKRMFSNLNSNLYCSTSYLSVQHPSILISTTQPKLIPIYGPTSLVGVGVLIDDDDDDDDKATLRNCFHCNMGNKSVSNCVARIAIS